jgi:Protein of unknown function (DUF1761)
VSFDVLGDLNWLAVLVGTIVYFGLGAVWYAPPVFGNVWMRAGGIQMPEDERPGAAFYVGPFITCLIATIAAAMVVVASGSDSLGEGIVVGLVTGLGIATSALFITGYFDTQKPEPLVWVAVVSGYHLLGLILAASIVALWE